MAQEIVLHTVSIHSRDRDKYNEKNYGIGYRVEKDNTAFQVGYYKNSEHNQTYYGMVDYYVFNNEVKAGVFVAAVTGYANFSVAGGFVFSTDVGPFTPRLRVVPAVGSYTGVIGLEIGVRF